MCGGAQLTFVAYRAHRGRDYRLAQCGTCGQHFCWPAPSETDIAGFYDGDYHAELRAPGAAERIFGHKFRRYCDWVREFLPSGRSLDIGTATGLFPAILKRSGFDAEGLEFNEASADWGSRHYDVRITPAGLSESVALKGSYDLISMTDVLEHTAHPLAFLQMVREYLKPGGFMLITFPDIGSPESRWLRLLARIFRREWIWSTCHIPEHVWEFTPGTARAMFSRAGFDIAGFRRSQEQIHFLPGKLSPLGWPLALLRIPLFGRLAGTQMEFMIRRRDSPSTAG